MTHTMQLLCMCWTRTTTPKCCANQCAALASWLNEPCCCSRPRWWSMPDPCLAFLGLSRQQVHGCSCQQRRCLAAPADGLLALLPAGGRQAPRSGWVYLQHTLPVSKGVCGALQWSKTGLSHGLAPPQAAASCMQQGLPGDSTPSPAAAPAVAALQAKLAGGADLGRAPARGVSCNATWTWRWTSGPCPTS